MDLEKELEKVKAYVSEEWFKPVAGMHKVVVLGEPTEDKYIEESTGKVTDQMVMPVEVLTKAFKWSVPRGKTLTSLWGQLLTVAKANKGFNGLVVDLIVLGDGKDKRYTIPKAAELITSEGSG